MDVIAVVHLPHFSGRCSTARHENAALLAAFRSHPGLLVAARNLQTQAPLPRATHGGRNSSNINWSVPLTPKACKDHLLIHQVDDEMVVYDKERKRAHRLNNTAARVWSLLDGNRTTSEIADDLDVDESVVTLSIDHLASAHLLESSEPPSVSRRKALGRVASAAAIGFLLPVVTSIAAPSAAQALSGSQAVQYKHFEGDHVF